MEVPTDLKILTRMESGHPHSSHSICEMSTKVLNKMSMPTFQIATFIQPPPPPPSVFGLTCVLCSPRGPVQPLPLTAAVQWPVDSSYLKVDPENRGKSRNSWMETVISPSLTIKNGGLGY